MTKEFYDFVYKNSPTRWGKINKSIAIDIALEKLLKNYINKKIKIIDLGCGIGRTLNYIYRPEWELYGIDYSQSAIDFAKKEIKKPIDIRLGNIAKTLFPDKYFDIVYSLGVFEHVEPIKFDEPRRILKDDGIFICYMPTITNKKENPKKETLFCKEAGTKDWGTHFDLYYTTEQWISIIKSSNFEVHEQKSFFICKPIIINDK